MGHTFSESPMWNIKLHNFENIKTFDIMAHYFRDKRYFKYKFELQRTCKEYDINMYIRSKNMRGCEKRNEQN